MLCAARLRVGENVAREVYEARLIRQGWNRWSRAVVHKQMLTRAQWLHDGRLIARCFLRIQYVGVHLRQLHKTAEVHRKGCVERRLMSALQLWRSAASAAAERAEDLQMRGHTQVALQLHRRTTLQRSFAAWRTVTDHGVLQRRRYAAAERGFRTAVLPRYFHAWLAFVSLQYRRRALAGRSARFRLTAVRSQVLTHWRAAANESWQRGNLARQAVNMARRHLAAAVLLQWRAAAVQSHRRNFQFTHAVQLQARRQRSGALQQWQRATAAKQLYTTAIEHHSSVLLRHSLRNWVRVWESIKTARLQHEMAVGADNRRQLLAAFRAWIIAANYAREYAEREKLATRHRQHRLTAVALHRWRQGTTAISSQRKLEAAADHFRQQRLIRAGLMTWRQEVAEGNVRRAKLDLKADAIRNARLAARAMNFWRQCVVTKVVLDRQEEIALWFWSVHVKRRALRAWATQCATEKAQELRLREALGRRRGRLLRTGIARWLHVAGARRNMRLESGSIAPGNVQSLTELVRHCALHWRQRALGNRGHRQQNVPTSTSEPRPVPKFIERNANVEDPRIRQQPRINREVLLQRSSRLADIAATLEAYARLTQRKSEILSVGLSEHDQGELDTIERQLFVHKPMIVELHRELSNLKLQWAAWIDGKY